MNTGYISKLIDNCGREVRRLYNKEFDSRSGHSWTNINVQEADNDLKAMVVISCRFGDVYTVSELVFNGSVTCGHKKIDYDILCRLFKLKFRIAFNDAIRKVIEHERLRSTYNVYRSESSKYEIDKIIFNGDATIVIFEDGEKVIVKRQKYDEMDREKAVAMAIMKRVYGTNRTRSNYIDKIRPLFDKAAESEAKREEKKNKPKTKYLVGNLDKSSTADGKDKEDEGKDS